MKTCICVILMFAACVTSPPNSGVNEQATFGVCTLPPALPGGDPPAVSQSCVQQLTYSYASDTAAEVGYLGPITTHCAQGSQFYYCTVTMQIDSQSYYETSCTSAGAVGCGSELCITDAEDPSTTHCSPI